MWNEHESRFIRQFLYHIIQNQPNQDKEDYRNPDYTVPKIKLFYRFTLTYIFLLILLHVSELAMCNCANNESIERP
jgi:hypothetical protein